MGKWISVKHKLPKKFGKYLTCDDYGNINIFIYREDHSYPFGISPNDKEYYMVSYWQSLPKPPRTPKEFLKGE